MENELYHYGVLGMHWGVRRNKSNSTSGGRKRSMKQKNMSEDAKTAATIKKKKVHEMSNSELKKLNERMNLEQNYSRLNKNKIAKGMAVVASAAATTNTLLNLYNNSDKLIKVGKKAMGR